MDTRTNENISPNSQPLEAKDPSTKQSLHDDSEEEDKQSE